MSDRPMRLLLVSDSYPPLIGGADLQVQMIARSMRDLGHRVAVVTPWQIGLAEREDDDGLEVHRVRPAATRLPWFSGDPARRHHPPFPDPAVAFAIRRQIGRLRPDLVHSYGWISYSAAAALLGTSIPLVLSARDYGAVCGVRNYLFHGAQVCSGPAPAKCLGCAIDTYTGEAGGSRVAGTAKAVAAVGGTFLWKPLLRRRLVALHSVSRFVQSVMDEHLLRSGRRLPIDVIIPSFLPPRESGPPDRALLDRLPAEPFILFVGSLLPQKGIEPLLAAYRRLRPPAPPLVLLGPSSYKSPTAFPPGVVRLGPTSHATVMAAWPRAMLGVVPSVGAETFGNVVTEALSNGCPVIASRLGGIVDIIEDGSSGLLVPPGDEAALAAAIQRLIDDPAERARLGAAGRERVQRFTADRVLPRFEALYREAIAAAGAGRSAAGGSPGVPA